MPRFRTSNLMLMVLLALGATTSRAEPETRVVALIRGGEIQKWSRLDRVRGLSEDVEAFDAYVLGTVRDYLRESGQLSVDK